MTKFRDGLIGPTVILFSICFVITLALALTYKTTKPIIDKAEIDEANAVCAEVLPGAGSFATISGPQLPEGSGPQLPEGVFEVYKSESGYVFKSGAKGFGGIVTYMIGIDNDGRVIGINMFDSNETPGLGTKIANPEYLKQYFDDKDPDSVDAVTGATKTSDSLKNSLKQAKEAYNIVKEAP